MHRAWETARSDALFKDPYAERLAGERGKQIVARMGRIRATRNGWPVITRTKILDDLVMKSIAEGCDCVLNLAAGLDARPYRLALPESLSWIEVDFPAMIEEKERALANDKPRCPLRREKVDLSDKTARDALFDDVAKSAKNVLVITEGLVVYLEDEQVRDLGKSLAARQPAFRWWALDFTSPAILQMMQKGFAEELAQSPMKFAPTNGVAFFEALGWKVRDLFSLFHEGVRYKRVPWLMRPLARIAVADPRNPGKERWSPVVRLERP
jgi:methyltransferase (TIGR00027 family)